MKINIYPSPILILFEQGHCTKQFLSELLQFNLFIKFFVVLTIFSLFSISEVTAQNLFPLKVGNVYQVEDDWWLSINGGYESGTRYYSVEVVRDTIINGDVFFSLLCNSAFQQFNNECLYRFDSLQQKLFVRIPNDSTTRLAVDFTLPSGSVYTSYISGSENSFTSQGISPVVFLGDTHFVYTMKDFVIPRHTYQFSDIIGFKQYIYHYGTLGGASSSIHNVISAIIDSTIYSPLVLTIDTLYPAEDRPINTFPYLLTIPYTASYSALVDSFYLDVEHFRSDTLVQNKIFNLSKSNPSQLTFNLDNLQVGDKIKFRATITDISIFYNVAHYPDTGWVVMNVLPPIVNVENGNIPLRFDLAQNYPNPFNPVTKISYQIPRQLFVTIKVFDVLGNEVVTLVQEDKSAGDYELIWEAENLTSGIYYYRISAGDFSQTKKMILLK